MNLKSITKKTLRKVGLDVRLVKNIEAHQKITGEEAWQKEWQQFESYKIKTIADIGANIGLFAKIIHNIFPLASIYSFEPIKECFDELKKNISIISNAKAFNIALGDKKCLLEINKSNFSPSSSILEMGDIHKNNWPESVEHIKESIKVVRLDDFFSGYNLEPELLIKIDVQGFEDKVIQGGIQTISKASVVVLEVSFRGLYKGQPLFDDIYMMMRELGFSYHGNMEQYASKIDGKTLYADAVFINNRIVSD